ncbi:MAG: nicotinate-nucleotide adenylyltransferase [Gammaproteobacteria bacterium]|nr:nicotinate-nucleotide adenylyltransferase [Gammaproteobacteria bacterium]
MTGGKPTGLIGGAFDPVHTGHIRIALVCAESLNLEKVIFIPANIAPHKTVAGAAPKHRLAMLERALKPYPQLAVDDLELRRGGISYTIDTLIELRAGHPEQSLCFIMGADAFITLPTWRRWQELTDYAHLVIIDRKQQGERRWDQRLQDHYAGHACASPLNLHTRPGGCIHKAAVTVPDISSSQARALLNGKQDTENILPPGIHDYIKENNLYS